MHHFSDAVPLCRMQERRRSRLDALKAAPAHLTRSNLSSTLSSRKPTRPTEPQQGAGARRHKRLPPSLPATTNPAVAGEIKPPHAPGPAAGRLRDAQPPPAAAGAAGARQRNRAPNLPPPAVWCSSPRCGSSRKFSTRSVQPCACENKQWRGSGRQCWGILRRRRLA